MQTSIDENGYVKESETHNRQSSGQGYRRAAYFVVRLIQVFPSPAEDSGNAFPPRIAVFPALSGKFQSAAAKRLTRIFISSSSSV